MNDIRPQSDLRTIPADSLSRYVRALGYVYREDWGKFLSRYSKKRSGNEYEVLVPKTSDISDYERRVYAFVVDISEYENKSFPEVIREISNTNYQIVRIVANEGSHENTLSFDSAIDLLTNGMVLIDASATVAVNGPMVGRIRGRRPDAVRKYLNQVRMGQTEVGSFVVNLLMPTMISADELGLPESEAAGMGASVAERFRNALEVASKIGTSGNRVSEEHAMDMGLTANFSDGLVNIIKAAESVSVGVGPHTTSSGRRKAYVRHFERDNLEGLEDFSERLSPIERFSGIDVIGTVTNITEDAKKSSGHFVIEAKTAFEGRSIRVPFTKRERETVFESLKNKAEFQIRVFGDIVDRSGHLRLENLKEVSLEPRGGLT